MPCNFISASTDIVWGHAVLFKKLRDETKEERHYKCIFVYILENAVLYFICTDAHIQDFFMIYFCPLNIRVRENWQALYATVLCILHAIRLQLTFIGKRYMIYAIFWFEYASFIMLFLYVQNDWPLFLSGAKQTDIRKWCRLYQLATFLVLLKDICNLQKQKGT